MSFNVILWLICCVCAILTCWNRVLSMDPPVCICAYAAVLGAVRGQAAGQSVWKQITRASFMTHTLPVLWSSIKDGWKQNTHLTCFPSKSISSHYACWRDQQRLSHGPWNTPRRGSSERAGEFIWWSLWFLWANNLRAGGSVAEYDGVREVGLSTLGMGQFEILIVLLILR